MSKTIIKVLFLPLVFFISFYGCKDNHAHGPEDDHFKAEGVVFYQSGNKVAEIFRGVTRDTVFAEVNKDGALTEIKFYDKNKKVLSPPDYIKTPLSWQIGDTSIVQLKQQTGKEGSYELNLRGKKAENTNINFFLMHAGHADFRSGKIPVKVK
jgi:hypothetical protein